ncbi:hypothetical protein SAMN04489712_11370 [Thermomonospora echinospora]|uniref:Integral membrane protein n=1 Tax=Thermomonospora echinospora TaxID=1992 RepID=A0A1H6D5N3_9ACTN|nr:hypothetical protein [Thermomonospora echinospora]SEG80374.1 hypothetical protein SAMN04489712_11370 [Thermomonospora echinospora]
MTEPLATVIIVAALVIAGYGLLAALRDRPMDRLHLAGLTVVEALLLAQAVLGLVKVAGDEGPAETATFVGYLLGILLIPPAGAGWGLLERSRWGPAVIVVAGLAVAVMTVRMNQIWSGTVA